MTTRARRAPVLGVMAAIVLLALNLRTLVAGLPPLLETIRDDLGLSGLAGGLLTTLPVLAFGAFAPLAPRLSRRVPIEWLLVGCALVTAGAAALRGAGGVAPLFLGCALAGVAVAVAQALLPVFIRTRHGEATGTLTGAYSMSLTLGAALAAALAVPLEEWLGSWEASLAAWSVPALVAAVVWTSIAWRSRSVVQDESPPGLWGNRLAWMVSLYMGMQSMAFYAGLTWIPTILEDHGYSAGSAGALQALSALVQLAPGVRGAGAGGAPPRPGRAAVVDRAAAADGRARAAAGDRRRAAVDRRARHRAGRRAGARPDPAGAARREHGVGGRADRDVAVRRLHGRRRGAMAPRRRA